MSDENQNQSLPTRPDGSGDLMGIYGVMFGKASPNGKASIVEGSIKTIHSLINQPYVAEALDRGVSVDILYTGPELSTEEERIMMREIGDFQIQRTIKSLPPQERVNLIEEDMTKVYGEKGLEGLTKHLTTVLFVDGEAVSQDSARGVAESFEKYLKE
ncbi:MAG: hypothetical protein AABW75_00140 [Nanoarchaeota archaeon]